MTIHARLAIPVAWLGLATGLFLHFFSLDRTDDYAGWIPAVVALQLPAYLTLRARAEIPGGPGAAQPFGLARALGLAIPAALMLALAAFFVGTLAGLAIWTRESMELRPFLLGIATAVVAGIAGVVHHVRTLRQRGGARRALAQAALAGAIPALAGLVRWSDMSRDPGLWLAVLAPLAWALPLWLMAGEPDPLPDAKARAGALRK